MKTMSVKPIGLVIKEIADEKKIKPVELTRKLGRGKTYAFDSFRRKMMSNEEISNWAELLEVSVDEILRRQTAEDTPDATLVKRPSENASIAGNANYLMKYLKELEDRISEQANTISEQAQTIRVLLGKSEPVSGSAGFAPRGLFLSPVDTNLGTGRIFRF